MQQLTATFPPVLTRTSVVLFCLFLRQERRALRERQRAIEEAEASRRRRVTVTVDILGRQVRHRIQCWKDLSVAAEHQQCLGFCLLANWFVERGHVLEVSLSCHVQLVSALPGSASRLLTGSQCRSCQEAPGWHRPKAKP